MKPLAMILWPAFVGWMPSCENSVPNSCVGVDRLGNTGMRAAWAASNPAKSTSVWFGIPATVAFLALKAATWVLMVLTSAAVSVGTGAGGGVAPPAGVAG